MSQFFCEGELVALCADLENYPRSIVWADDESFCDKLCNLLDFELYQFFSGDEENGWEIPLSRTLEGLTLRQGDHVIFTDDQEPLSYASGSQSFSGQISFDELMKHTMFIDDAADVPWDWTRLYRADRPSWGICLPGTLVKTLNAESEYSVELRVRESPHSMKIFEFNTNPTSSKTLILNAHTCHPHQANDGISGVVTAIAAAKRWQCLGDEDLNLRLIFAPELIGPAFYLNRVIAWPPNEDFLGSISLNCLGSPGLLVLQETFETSSTLDLAIQLAARDLSVDLVQKPFRQHHGNDEIMFACPPFNIPSAGLSRFPFAQYHTSADRASRLDEDRLEESVSLLLATASILSRNARLRFEPKGFPRLSTPRGDLSAASHDSLGRIGDNEINRALKLLDCTFPMRAERGDTTLQIAHELQIPFEQVNDYTQKWVRAGLLSTEPA